MKTKLLGRIDKLHSMVEITRNSGEVEYVVCSGFKAENKPGSQRCHGHHFSTFASACVYAAELTREITYDRMSEIATRFKDALQLADDELLRETCEDDLFMEEHEYKYFEIGFSNTEPDYDDDDSLFDDEDFEDFDEDNRPYTSSATNGDYSPSCPWNAPGMSIKDFI